MLTNLANHDCDRFIPHRSFNKGSHPDATFTPHFSTPNSAYSNLIKKRLFFDLNQKVINFNEREKDEFIGTQAQARTNIKLKSNIQSPVKILDVPKYRDDFYLNNIDWSERGPLAIALGNELFLYTPQNLIEIGRTPFNTYPCGIKVNDYIMAVGLSNGMVQIYDIEKGVLARTLSKHQNRVSALTFADSLLVTGSKDKSILINDLRQKNHVIKEFRDHKGEICTLKTKPNNENIFASGSNDGSAIIWDVKYGKIQQFKGHKGAVKALDWCPWKSGLLATGGGNNTEKSIKIWNTTSSKLILHQNINSQISSLLWNQELKMLISSHGYEENQLNFWSLQPYGNSCRLEKQKSFKAHQRRILNMVQSHDKQYLCTVGADENMKFFCLRDTNSNPFNQKSHANHQEFIYRI